MLKRNNIRWLIFACLMLFFLSYVRESYFLTLNGVIHRQPEINSYVHWFYELFSKLSVNALSLLKWVSTIVFSASFVGVTLFFLFKYFNQINYLKVVGYFYTSLVVLMLIAGVLGAVLDKFQQFYGFIRFLAGIIQSPLIFFIAIPVFSFIRSFNK